MENPFKQLFLEICLALGIDKIALYLSKLLSREA